MERGLESGEVVILYGTRSGILSEGVLGIMSSRVVFRSFVQVFRYRYVYRYLRQDGSSLWPRLNRLDYLQDHKGFKLYTMNDIGGYFEIIVVKRSGRFIAVGPKPIYTSKPQA